MRYAKKAIMVPEEEYFALLSKIKGGNYINDEKATIEGKIRQNLSDPKLSQSVKAHRHDWLYKKRRQLKEIEENRPQKVTVENMETLANLAPYLGIKQPKSKINDELEVSSKKKVRIKSPRIKQKESTSNKEMSEYNTANNGFTTDYSSSNETDEEYIAPKKGQILFKSSQRTQPKNINSILNIITKNPQKFGVTTEGKILNNRGQIIKESNLMENIKFISGQGQSPPRGFTFFMQKINKDPEIAKYFIGESEQSGTGKSKWVRVKVKPIKTPGIVRIPNKKFKPIIWAKL